MTKAKPPIRESRSWNVVCSSLLIDCIHLFCIIFLLISGLVIIWNYVHLLLGLPLSSNYEAIMNYSITIFAGTAIYLLAYTYNLEDIVKRMFNVRNVKPLAENPRYKKKVI